MQLDVLSPVSEPGTSTDHLTSFSTIERRNKTKIQANRFSAMFRAMQQKRMSLKPTVSKKEDPVPAPPSPVHTHVEHEKFVPRVAQVVKAETAIVGNLMTTGKPCIRDPITDRYRRKKTLVADSSPPVSRVDVVTDSRQISDGQTGTILPQPQSEPSDGELLHYTLVKDGALPDGFVDSFLVFADTLGGAATREFKKMAKMDNTTAAVQLLACRRSTHFPASQREKPMTSFSSPPPFALASTRHDFRSLCGNYGHQFSNSNGSHFGSATWQH